MKWDNRFDDVTKFAFVGLITNVIYYGGLTAVFCTVCIAFVKVVMK